MRALTHASLDLLVEEARLSPRKRQHANVHQRYDDPCQRLFNAITVESYIRPHRHMIDPRCETLLAVRGSFALLLFGEGGEVLDVVRFSAGSILHPAVNVGVEVAPADWHTVIASESGSVLLEIKAGPFDPAAAKEFAPWAPAEDAVDAVPYFRELQRAAGCVTAWKQH